jgi:hypothetical protein
LYVFPDTFIILKILARSLFKTVDAMNQNPAFFRQGELDKSTLYDLMIFPISKIARNTNPGSFEAYSYFVGILLTGLIGAFFVANFPIINIMASNRE